MQDTTRELLRALRKALFKTAVVVAIVFAVVFYVGSMFEAESERAAGKEWARAQPAIVTNNGIFTCQLEYEGAFVNKDKRLCVTYRKVAELPEGAKYEMEIPEGVTEFVKR